jgi:hypothetical protein
MNRIITIHKFITKKPLLISQNGKENIINKVKDKIDYHLKCCKSEVENIEVKLKVKFLQNNKVSSSYLINIYSGAKYIESNEIPPSS